MPGAIVPNDWDGVSYTERKVTWPDSPQWLSILGGGLSRPALVEFWDDTDSTADLAAAIGSSLISLNVDGIYFPGLCEANEAMKPTFLADPVSNQSIPAATWTKVIFDHATQWNGDTGYDGNQSTQDLSGKVGVWLYEIGLAFSSNTVLSLRIIDDTNFVWRIYNSSPASQLRWIVPYILTGINTVIRVEVFTANASVINAGVGVTHWAGTKLSDIP